jgi:predicted enzyme related to lactoylglutathione lyase
MKTIKRMMTNICSDKLPESREFYTKLFDFRVDYDSDWFVHLVAKNEQLELGIISRSSEIVPAGLPHRPQGFYITFVVENADAVFAIAKKEGLEVVSEPADTFYGQWRLLLKDPNGTLVDVSSPIANFK